MAKTERSNRAMQEISLSIIIVNYNVKEFLEQCLISIKKALKNISSEIIVIDNASRDGSAELIRTRFPGVHLVANSKNVGFAKASNQGLRRAQGKFIALLNPDTIVQEDTFSCMIEYFNSHPDTGMLGCKILNPDGTLQLACRRSYPTPWVALTKMIGLSFLFPKSRIFGKYNLTYLNPDESYEVEAISGSFMMIQHKILDDVGFLDESYFLYGEDLDWCYRIREKGWKVRYSPVTQIIHFKGESSKRSQFDNLRIFYHAMVLFVQKHFKHKYLLMPHWILLGAIWLRAGLSFLKKILVTLAVPITDFILLILSLVLGVYIRFGSFVHLLSFIPIDIAYSFIWMAALYLFGSHDKHKFSSSKAGSAIVIGFLFNASLTFFFKQYAFSRAVVLYASFLSLVVVPGWRLIIKFLPQLGLVPFKGTLGKTLLGRKTVIVGDFKSGEKLLKKFNSKIDVGYDIAGLISINGKDTGCKYQGMKVLGSVDELSSIIREEKIQEVIFSTHRLSYDKVMDIISRSKSPRVNFKLVPSNLEVIIGKASIDPIDDMPLLEIDYKLHQNRYRLLKRLLDIIFALVGGVLFLPIFLYKKYLTSAKLTKSIVHGLNNRPISIYEFESNHSNFFDKIPYIWSILKGDLSFVGSEIVEFSENSKHLKSEKSVLIPGLTGLVHVNRHRHLSQEDKGKYYLFYMKNYSPFLDIEIIFKALFRV